MNNNDFREVLDIETPDYIQSIEQIKVLCNKRFYELYNCIFENSDTNLIFSRDDEFKLVYYNPDSVSGGQIVECKFETSDMSRIIKGEDLMDVLAENTQHLSDINSEYFFNTIFELIEAKEKGDFLGTDINKICQKYSNKEKNNLSLDSLIDNAKDKQNKSTSKNMMLRDERNI